MIGAQLTVGELFLNSVIKYPKKTAIIFEDRPFTFEEFNARINRLANGLLSLGLTKGDHVAVMLGNCNEIVEVMMAVAKNGMVAVPVSFRFVASEIEYVVNQSESKAFIVGEEFLETVAQAQPNLRTVTRYISIAGRPVRGMDDYEQLMAGQSESEPEVEVLETDAWYIGYTSGTTGFPKGAVASHRARTLPALFTALEFGLTDTDAQLMVMPLFHGNGIMFSMLGLCLGNTVFIMRRFDAEGVLRATHEHKLTYGSLVPTMYSMILSLPEATKSKYDVSSMRVLISSSSPLLTKTKEEILQFFASAELNEFYGSTEAGPVTNLRHRDQMRKTRCVGQATFGTKVKLLDENGDEVAPGEVGELYSFSHSFSEYYKMPEATKAAFRGEWVSVGDMARMDDERYVYIVDRKKDMIISGGENIYPAEIEEVLSRHPAVKETAVIGVRHEKWGESVHAVIVPHDAASATAESILEFCRSRLAGYKQPRSVEFVESLPKNPTGKILKRIVREKYWHAEEIKV